MSGLNPTIFYLGIVFLACISLAATYFKILPDASTFTIIVSLLVGHGVTVVSQNVKERQLSQPSSPS